MQENQVVFGVDGIWLTARRIDGQFPNYKQLLPEQFEAEVHLPREELLDVVRRTGLLAQRKSPLRLRFDEGELTVSAQTQDVGEARESLPGRVRGRAARDRLQRRVPSRRARVDHRRDGSPEADQPAAPRAPARRERRLPLPDHADQAGRLIVARATLRSFRSYADLDLGLEPGLVLVVGRTASARRTSSRRSTSVLRASRREPAPSLGWFASASRRPACASQGTESGAPGRDRGDDRARRGQAAAAQRGPLASAEELRARLAGLAFVPDRLAIVKGGPAVRRAYVDRMLGRFAPSLAGLPGDYGRALAQRNEALRRVRAGVSNRDAVEPWTEQVAALGTELDAARAELVSALGPGFTARTPTCSASPAATLAYDVRGLPAADLESRLERDLERGTTGLGPHLRDVEIRAAGRDLRGFGSQGEQRTAVLALLARRGGRLRRAARVTAALAARRCPLRARHRSEAGACSPRSRTEARR